jgi:hypothetical protein
LKKPFGKLVIVSVLMTFLLSSFLVAGGFNKAEAQETEPSELSAASGSNRFVVWVDNTPGNNEILFRRCTDNGATWQPITNLSSNPGDSLRPQIAASGSNVYVVWTQINSEGTSGDVFVRKSANNGATWKSIAKISSNAGTSIAPHVAAKGSSVYVVWQDDTPGNYDILSRRSTNNGATWDTIRNLSNSTGISSFPQLAV